MNIEILSSIIDKQTADVSVLFKNLSTGTTLYEKNIHKQVRSASIIKLFILSKCADAFEKGLYSPQDILPVPPEEKVSFSLLSDLNQPSWRLDDMASLMIILSDNTATNLLIDLFNMDKINAHISGLGGDQTVLQRKMMDTAAARMGLENYTSLHDAAQLLEGIYQEASKGHVYSQWMLDVLSKQRDRSMLRRYLPES
ncbi:Beta-lactamase, class-A like protein, partial [Aduncisulcus paluster]